MAEISSITLPNGSVYDLKSNVANKFSSNRTITLTGDVTGSTSSNGENGWSIATTINNDSHNHTTQTIVPIKTKTYTGLLGTASNNAADDSFYFMSIKPDDFYAQWKVTYRITATIPNRDNYRTTSVVTLYGLGQDTAPIYYIYNQIYSTSYRPYYYHNFQRLTEAGFNAGYGNAVGIGLRSSNARDTDGYERTIKIELLETDLCTVTFLDDVVKWANWIGTGSINYEELSEFNGYSNGLQETGDANTNYYDRRFLGDVRLTAGGVGIFPYSLIMQDINGTWQSLTTTGGTKTSKAVNTTGFIPNKIYWFYYNTTIASGSLTTIDYIYETHSAADLRYTFNCGKTLTVNKALYLIGTFINGLFYIDSTMYSQDLPISEDGKCYMYLGEVVSTYTLSMSALHPIYMYVNGAIREISLNAINDINGNPISSYYATLSTTQTITGAKTFIADTSFINDVIIGENNNSRILINNNSIQLKDSNDNDYFKISSFNNNYDFSIGYDNEVTGLNSYVIGDGLVVTHDNQIAIGKYNKNDDYIFIIGNGTSDSIRSNALTVDGNGKITSYSTDITIDSSPSNDIYNPAYRLADKNGIRTGWLKQTQYTDGRIGTGIDTIRTVNGSDVTHGFCQLIDNDGNRTVTFSDNAAWRAGLGLSHILDMVRVTRFQKANVSISANSTASVEMSYTVPTGFNSGIAVGIRFDSVDTTSAANANYCVAPNYWVGSDGKLHAIVRNLASSNAKVTVHWYVWFIRTSL